MTETRTNSCTLCVLIPLILGVAALLFFYFTARDSIADSIQNDLALKSNQLLKEKQIGNVTVSMDGRDALLTGTVASQERSNEIENVVASMNGIRVVENQLTIAKKNELAKSEAQITSPKVEPVSEPEPLNTTEATQITEPPQELVVEELLQTLDLSGIQFLFGKDEITDSGKQILDEVVKVLSEHNEFNVAIHGHTDNIGDGALNLQLSQQRAQSVLNYLTSNGIQLERLSAIGFGENAPIADNSTAEGRALNRRIEFEVSRIQ